MIKFAKIEFPWLAQRLQKFYNVQRSEFMQLN